MQEGSADIKLYDPQNSASNAQQLTSQIGSRIEHLRPTDNIIVLFYTNLTKQM